MKRFMHICIAACLFFIFHACKKKNPCEGAVCEDSKLLLLLPLSATDSSNLLFGDKKIYKYDSIQVYSVSIGGQKTKLNYNSSYLYSGGKSDSALVVHTDDNMNVVIEYNATAIDSLNINYHFVKEGCCYNVRRFTGVNFMDSTISGGTIYWLYR